MGGDYRPDVRCNAKYRTLPESYVSKLITNCYMMILHACID